MTAEAPGDPPALEARGICKTFADVVANADATLTVRRGEVHALLGENGAGKTTLASILSGLYQPDSGQVLRNGQPIRLRSPRDGLAMGIGMVHQHFRLVDPFTVAENVALGDPGQPMWLSTSAARNRVEALAQRYELDLDSRAVAGRLSVGERQRVEIVKTLARGVDVVLLDEPTAVLTPQEIGALARTLAVMARDGVGVVLITHKLGEVMSMADRVTVMRDGRIVGETTPAATDPRQLARLMVGRDVELTERAAEAAPAEHEAVLEVEAVSWAEPFHRAELDGVSLSVGRGEVLGVAGVAGHGQKPLAEVIAGLLRPRSGRVRIAGRDVTGRGPRAARAAGLAYVPEDRLGTGLVPSLPLADNLLLTRPRPFLYRRKRAMVAARDLLDRFSVRAPGPATPVGQLSGGNAQKVLLARELTAGARALLVASPTRGLDVGSVQFIWRLLLEERKKGRGILLMSEDLDEIRSLSDRIMVLYRGRVALERRAAEADVTDLGLAMAGEPV